MAEGDPTVFQTYPPERTPTIGLAYTGDEVMNRNLARIDEAFAELARAAGIVPTPPPEVREQHAPDAMVEESGDQPAKAWDPNATTQTAEPPTDEFSSH